MPHTNRITYSTLRPSRSQDNGFASQSTARSRDGSHHRGLNSSKLPVFSKQMMLASVKDVPLPQDLPSTSAASLYSSSAFLRSSSSPVSATESSPPPLNGHGNKGDRDVPRERVHAASTPRTPDFLFPPNAHGLQERRGPHQTFEFPDSSETSGLFDGLDDEFDIPTPRPRNPEQSPTLDSARISAAISAAISRKSSSHSESRNNSASGSGAGFRAYLAETFTRHRSKASSASEQCAKCEQSPDYIEHFEGFSSKSGIDSGNFFKRLDRSSGRNGNEDSTFKDVFIASPSSASSDSKSSVSSRSPIKRHLSAKRGSTATTSTLEDTPPSTPTASKLEHDIHIAESRRTRSRGTEYGIPADPFKHSKFSSQFDVLSLSSSNNWPSSSIELQDDEDNQLTPVPRPRFSSYDFSIYESPSPGPGVNANFLPCSARGLSRLYEGPGVEVRVEGRATGRRLGECVEGVRTKSSVKPMYDYIECMGFAFPLPPELPEEFRA